MEASSRWYQDLVASHEISKHPAGVETTGPNTWAVTTEDGDDGLTTYTHLAGPGIPGLIAAKPEKAA